MTSLDSLSPSCRILVISSDISHSHSLVEKVLNHTQLQDTGDNSYDQLDVAEGSDKDDTIYEWTISNKYYTAPVHFHVTAISLPPAKPLWPPEQEDEKVPAIVFAFTDGEQYRQRFLSMKEGLGAHDAEVAIATRLQLSEDGPPDEDAEAVNEFFAEHGFEFVDLASPTARVSDDAEAVHSLDLQSGIPRIVSALHTIMWPSMIRKDNKIGLHRKAADALDDDAWDPSHETSALAPDEDDLKGEFDPSFLRSARESLFESADGAIQERDLQALEAWLDGDDDEAWKGYPSQSLNQAEGAASGSKPSQPAPIGFEDDFAGFVTAAPGPSNATDYAASHLPSEAEIALAAQRIFGGSSPKIQTEDEDEDEPFDFDLSQVLGALQSMKEEVAGIKDLDARRKAAARIAMGFAAGLGLGGSEDVDPTDAV